VGGAIVTILDKNNQPIETLKEGTDEVSSHRFVHRYTGMTKPLPGETYTAQVKVKDESLQAISHVPEAVPLRGVEIEFFQIFRRWLLDADAAVLAMREGVVEASPIAGNVAAAMGDADFQFRKTFEIAVEHQLPDAQRGIQRMPDRVREIMIAHAPDQAGGILLRVLGFGMIGVVIKSHICAAVRLHNRMREAWVSVFLAGGIV